MRAFIQDRYGGPEVLELRDVDEPAVGDDAVLVRVRATSANPADWHTMRGDPGIARLQMGLRRPKDAILGGDLAGEVEAAGPNVTRFKPGDEVFGCTFGHGLGAFAELCACKSEDVLEGKPANVPFDQAAAVPIAGITALQALRTHGGGEAGQKVLIIGASGGVGTFAVQLATILGAEVTGVCSSRNLELVRSLGADHVIDYTEDDFVGGEERYDLIFQSAGTKSPSECRRALTDRGTLILSSGEPAGRLFGPIGRMVRGLIQSPFVSQRIATFVAKPNPEDLRYLRELIEAGELIPVIDRTYPMSELPEAIGYLEQGHARGKVVVSVSG